VVTSGGDSVVKMAALMFTREELTAAHDHFMAMSQAAQAGGSWEEYCDLFTEDAVYIEHFLGTSHGREEIKKWFIPAMAAWPQMTYPLRWRTFDEQEGLVAFAVDNDMPDVNGTGPYTVQSWTVLQYAGNNQWSLEEDIYNPDTMLKMLSSWCEAAGVPFPEPDFGD
jgi:ketosteroid isomerase-like protein